MNIHVECGQSLEIRRPDGSLEPLSVEQMAEFAFKTKSGKILVPMETWEKHFPGQITLGRIGCPVIRFCPISWLPSKVYDAVLAVRGALPVERFSDDQL